MNSVVQWSNQWIHGYDELMGEFLGTMNQWVNSWVQWINGWIHGYYELTGEFMDTMN